MLWRESRVQIADASDVTQSDAYRADTGGFMGIPLIRQDLVPRDCLPAISFQTSRHSANSALPWPSPWFTPASWPWPDSDFPDGYPSDLLEPARQTSDSMPVSVTSSEDPTLLLAGVNGTVATSRNVRGCKQRQPRLQCLPGPYEWQSWPPPSTEARFQVWARTEAKL
jgi:hypothetical protein